MAVRRTAVADALPLKAEDVIAWGKIDPGENAAILDLAIQQAVQEAEHETGRRLRLETWEIDVLAGDVVTLRDVMPVVSVKQGGVELALSGIELVPTVVAPADGVIVVECGYADPKNIPPGVRMWMIHRVITSAECRQFVLPGNKLAAMPRQYVDGLLDPARISF